MLSTDSFMSKYELSCAPIRFGDLALNLYTIENWAPFIEAAIHNQDGQIESLPFWFRIWEASIVLTDYVLQLNLPADTRILEIGAGMGLTGLFLGAKGYDVTITDYETDAVVLIQKNITHNELKNTKVNFLDWYKPDIAGQFDIIIGSEILYRESFFKPICDLIFRYLKPDGSVYISHDMIRRTAIGFFQSLPEKISYTSQVRKMQSEKEMHRIVIHTLSFRS